jgi:type IV pilus assembly protein PilE
MGPGSGFTLVELMIVTALAAILLTLAIPSYRNTMMRVHRAEAIRILNEAALCQQRLRAFSGYYDTGLCRGSESSRYYTLSYSPPDNAETDHFEASAGPKGNQQGDACGAYTLDSDGNHGVDGPGANEARCWESR